MSAGDPAAGEHVFGVTLPPRPYPGLRPFNLDEWPIFFGRERMIDEIADRLIRQQLLVVHGDSGCGKSSLIRAGVMPRLTQDSARGGTPWTTCVVAPGDEPLATLARALAGLGGDGDDRDARALAIRRVLNSGEDGAAALVDLLGGDRGPYVCLLIDQFEEIFAHARRHGRQQATLLVGLLIGLSRLQTPRLFVTLTMRSEFLGACAQFEGFAEAVNATQYLLPRMAHADLVRAIREPATLYTGEIAPALAERLIAEARGSQDQLPLIQHGLMLLHRQRAPRPDEAWRLSLEHYKTPGGLSQLLSDHADQVMARVEPPDVPGGSVGRSGGRVTEDIFRTLTDINADGQATRRPQRFRDVVAITGASEAEVRRIVDAFRAEGVSFMRPYGADPIADDDALDISHEALIRCWRRIAGADGWLIREFKNGLIWRSLLVQADSFDRDPSNILSPATAEERHAWLKRRNAVWSERYGSGWTRVVGLIDASMAERERILQEQVEARSREERARVQAEQLVLREEQARLREHALQSELAAAVEKTRRVTLFRWGMVVSLVLLAMTALGAVTAYQESRRARLQSRRATEAAAAAEQQRKRAESERERADYERQEAHQQRVRAEETAATVLAELDKLRRVAAAAPSYGALREEFDKADYTITQGVNALLSPRVYIHIADESQRTAARALELRIEAARLGGRALVVPGIQRITYAPPRALLRCFVDEECREYGQKLLAIVNAPLESPKLTLQNFSRTYTADGRMRPLHFEIYFAPGPIALIQSEAKSAY